jgi:patatin-like phospholipase
MKRPEVEQQHLLKMRSAGDEQAATTGAKIIVQLLERTKAEYDRRAAAGQPPPVIDILIVSGGGDWGAFGAGFLKGWKKVPTQHPLAKPEFDAVTGVSTGALIAPFAFLGDERSTDEIVNLYRNPGEDWVKQRGMLFFLPDNISFAEVPGLEREMRSHITMDLVRRVASAAADGRLVAVNTTNLDNGTSRVFDLGAEARRAVAENNLDRIHSVMLASAGIPGAFPFRMIDDELYVDGGVTGNIVYGGRITEDQSLAGPMAKSLSKPAGAENAFLGDFQQPVPPDASSYGAELAGGHSKGHGNFDARGDGDGSAPSLRDRRNIAAQAQGRRGGAYRLDSW